MTLAAAVTLVIASSAAAAPTTITLNEGQIKFGGMPDPVSAVNPEKPVRLNADISEVGAIVVTRENFDFPPATTQMAGQSVTLDLIPQTDISGDYDRATGELETELSEFTLQAEFASGSCEVRDLPLFLSTEQQATFTGERFDPDSVPPVNGAVVGSWSDLVSDGGLGCVAFNQLANGQGGIRLANTGGTDEGGDLSITAKPKHISSGQRAKIRGSLSGVPSGNAGHAVELIEYPYPYDEPSAGRPVDVTSPDGSYSFRVKPQFNTMYVVRDTSGSGAQSRELKVWVWERGHLELDVKRGPKASARWTLRFGRDLDTDFTKRRMFWYFQKKGERTMTLKDRTRIRQKPGVITAKATFGIPSKGRYRFYVNPCFDEPRGDDGTGKPRRFRCPRKKHPTIKDFRY